MRHSLKYIHTGFFVFLFFSLYAQNQSEIDKGVVFGQIFADFRYSLKDVDGTQTGFNFNQGIIGYKRKLSDKLSAIIMYDVTRTTHLYSLTDSLGIPVYFEYFEGSKYTSFLKMAEIKYKVNDVLTLRVGQLLNTQYLTFQDRFWDLRFVDVTFQEKFRLGMPADFGAQADIHIGKKIVNQLSVTNGEGPFRHQDSEGKFLYCNNIQYAPTEQITLKLYTDFSPDPKLTETSADKSVIAGFAGYKTNKMRFGGEYVFVSGYNYQKDVDYSGFSVFGAMKVSEKLDVLARYDHLDLDMQIVTDATDYVIAGFQYKPEKLLMTALTFRYFSPDELPLIYASFGVKF